MKQLSPKDAAELHRLRERALLTMELIERVESLGAFGEQMRAVVEAQCAKKSVRGLRLAMREIDTLTIALPRHQREGLEAVLNARLGVDKDAEREALRAHVSSVLQRGHISSEAERNQLERYVEMLDSVGGDPQEMQAVIRLLHGN